MHMAIGCVLIRLFTFQQTPSVQRRNATIITVGLTAFITYHCLTDEFILHVLLFLTLSITVALKTRSLTKTSTRPEAHKKQLSSLVGFASCM